MNSREIGEWAQEEGYFSDPRELQWVKVSPGELRDLAGVGDNIRVYGMYSSPEVEGIKKHLIITPYKASTSTKVHELTHHQFGHTGYSTSAEESLEKELLVEMKARGLMDRDVSARKMTGLISGEAFEWGLPMMSAYSMARRVADRVGFKRPREWWSKVWKDLKENY